MRVTPGEAQGFYAALPASKNTNYAAIVIGLLELARRGYLDGVWLLNGKLVIRKNAADEMRCIGWRQAQLFVETAEPEKENPNGA